MLTATRRRFLRTATATAAGITFIPSCLSAGIGGNPASDTLTLGMIGCGKQALGLAHVMQQVPGTRLVAACDLHPAKLAKFVSIRQENLTAADRADETSIATYADYRQLLDHHGLDAVVVAVPDHQHATVCIEALDRGLHVYCEKPLAHTVEEGRAMAEAVARSGKVLQTGSMQRSMFNFGRAVELVQSGELGEVKEVLVGIGPPPRPFDLEGQTVPEGLDWKAWIGPSVMRPYNPVLLPPPDLDIWGKWRGLRRVRWRHGHRLGRAHVRYRTVGEGHGRIWPHSLHPAPGRQPAGWTHLLLRRRHPRRAPHVRPGQRHSLHR